MKEAVCRMRKLYVECEYCLDVELLLTLNEHSCEALSRRLVLLYKFSTLLSYLITYALYDAAL